nr:hypothetical protein [Schwartzia sp. (in: firmicutes)]
MMTDIFSNEKTADRTHIGTVNVAVTGAYDDTNEKGETDAQTYTLKDHFGGAIVGNRLRSLLDLTENGTVTIGKNAKITTNNLQEYVAASDNDLTNHASAKGGGAMAIVDAVTENKINVHNTVDVQSGANLSNEKAASKEGIVLTAYDDQSLNSHVESTVGGLANGLVSINEITMNRTSDVKVAGTIESGSNVGLYAGANATGALSNLNADLKAATYNYAAFAVTDPQVKYTIAADKGTVAVSGTVRSTADINAIASGGREEVMKDQSLWNWVNGGSSTDKKFLSSSATTAEESSDDMKKSTVNVTGSLIAGTADPINLTIGGSVANANGLTISADNNQANNRVKNGVTQGTFDYANTLGARLTELDKLIAAYDGDATKMAAYIAERTRIQDEMKKLGLVETDAEGNVVQYHNSGRPVYYVEIPDIATSGGNINVTANHFTGTGTLEANSAPGVAITNQSDAYLKLNNILMGEQGGKIVYNQDNVIPPGESQGNAAINNINVGKTGASFGKIYGVVNGEAANLLVRNTFSGERTSTISLTPKLEQEINATDLTAAEKEQYKQDIRDGKMTYTAIPDVEVNGKISNFYGQVEINNTSGDIRISGGTQDRPTGVEGNTVKLIAGNGSIAQDYKEGIVNINGDPEKYYATQAQSLKDPVYNIYKSSQFQTSSWQTRKTDCERTDDSRVATGYIAGRDVYVSAANINVNGLIQSGYKNYTATVTEDQLKEAQKCLADNAAVVQNRTMYRVNKGGAKWNSTEKVFDYEPQVYWDPSTKQLFVEDIDTAGGKVYLTGMIASTGDGKILAADGAANISVTNNTALDMNVGKVLNNQREGVITIADTAKDTWTEYKKGQTRSITGYSAYLKENAKKDDLYANATVTTDADKILSVDRTLTYDPKANQAYTWIEGATTETSATYEHYERRGFWGLVQTADTTQLKAWENNSQPVEPAKLRELGLPSGATIEQDFNYHNFFTDDQAQYLKGVDKLDVTKYAQEANQLWLYSQNNVKAAWTYDREHWVTRSGFLGWFKHIHDRWKTGSNTVQFYQYSLNASQPITIGLIGEEAGKINIKSANAAGGNINLTGNMANSHNEAKLSIISRAGGITQFDNTLLKSEDVTLIAKKDIKNIHLASIGSTLANGDVTDSIDLYAVSNGAGSIDIDAVGGLRNNRSLPGNVEVAGLESNIGTARGRSDSAIGSVSLSATGNITQYSHILGTVVAGRGINLTSKNGAIGTAAKPVEIMGSDLVYSTDRYGAQVNASANGSIYLTEAARGGDMRVGKIESKTGDVTLTVKNGGFLDALPNDNKAKSTESVDDMVHRWIDAGLIAGENGYEGAYIRDLKKNRDDYAARITSDYAAYAAKKNAANTVFASQDYQDYKNGTGAYAGMDDARKSAKLLADGHQDYLTYKDYTTADAYLKTTDGYKFNGYASADAYLAKDAKYKDLKNKAENPTYEWTKDMMLYAVSDKLVNPESGGSAQTAKTANVLGRNVTLTSTHGKVGNVSDTSTEITVEQLTGDDKITHMKALMNMDASDVKAVRDDNGKLMKFVITPDMPLGVKATGTLDVQAGGDVSVAGRTDAAGEHSAINVGTVNATNNNATGDVRLYSDKGITNALEAADGINIKGNNLILAGGKESIGASDKPLTVFLSGDLVQARADKNVFIKNMNDDVLLRLGSLYAADTISLASEKGFLMSDANSGIAESYINARKKLEFNTNVNTGIVGEDGNSIRILNDRAPVNIAAKSAYIKGVNSSSVQNGTLVLGTVDTKEEFVADSEGSLTVGREKDKDKEAVTGNVKTGGDATLSAANDLTLDGKVSAGDLENAKKVLTLKAKDGSITQTDKGAITAGNVTTVNGKSLLLENENNQFDSINVTSGNDNKIAGDVRIKDNADALTVAVTPGTAGNISVQNLKDGGTLANVGDLTATGNISLGAQGDVTQAANTTLTAGVDVTLASAEGSVAQAEGASIKAPKVTAISAKDVLLNQSNNAIEAITVQSSKDNTPLAGNVSIVDSASKLELDIQPAVRGNITAENKQAQGRLHVISSLEAEGDGTDNAKGDITLTSDGSLQTDVKLTAANNVALASVGGDVSINGDITTGGQVPEGIDFDSGTLRNPYNVLDIYAGGAIREVAGVKIETPVVKVLSGKGVSLASENNKFGIFLLDALEGREAIDGSVKVVSDYHSGSAPFAVAVGASIKGDAEFSNHHKDGSLSLLSWKPDNENEEITAEGSLVLNAGKDVYLLSHAKAGRDLVISSEQGSFLGIGRGMEAGHDICVTAGDSAQYRGTSQKGMTAGHDIDIQVKNPSSRDGISIGNLTSLVAGHEARFEVKSNGNIALRGNITADTGNVVANISGEGDVLITESVKSENESVSVQTGKGAIYIGVDNKQDDETVKAKKNVTVGTGLG